MCPYHHRHRTSALGFHLPLCDPHSEPNPLRCVCYFPIPLRTPPVFSHSLAITFTIPSPEFLQLTFTMEAVLGSSRAMCPFLKKTSPATLRTLSTATHQSPGGGTITNLQHVARRCPIMSKALAVQSARIKTANFATAGAAKAGAFKSIVARKIHTSAERKANVEPSSYKKNGHGKFDPHRATDIC